VPRTALLCFASAAACWVDPVTTQATNMPEWYANNVKGYAETAAGLPPETTLASDFRVAGEVARWRECTAIDACGRLERERPAAEVLAVEHVGHAIVGDAGEVEVVRLSLAPRPKYTVPVTRMR
jgi:hypothetical protein